MAAKSSSKKTSKPTKKVAGKAKASPRPKKGTAPKKAASPINQQEDVEVLHPEVVLPWEPPADDSEISSSTALTPSDPLSRYIAEIRRYPLLTREQEQELTQKYKATRDPAIAQVLVTSNLRFVVKIAAEYTKFGAKLIDLIQEGNVGLMHAVKEFNPDKGVRLITYAVWWIRGFIQEFLMRQYSMVRIGTTQNQRKLFYQLQKQSEELERLGFKDAVAQISGRLGVSEEEVIDMKQRLSGRDVSLDAPVNEAQTSHLLDMQSDPNEVELDDQLGHLEQLKMLREKIEDIRPDLNEKELFLLDNRLLADEPLTLQDIGDKYGITREAVRQLEARLLLKLRKQMLPEDEEEESI